MSRPHARTVSFFPFFIVAGIFSWAVFFPGAVLAQFSSGTITVSSVSGQFVAVSGPEISPLLRRAEFATNADYIRLEPAFLAVSAERFKGVLWQQLGLRPDGPWYGKIFLELHPAHTPDDPARITVGPFLKSWNCHVELPDLVPLARYGRSLAAALLLEIAIEVMIAVNHDHEPDQGDQTKHHRRQGVEVETRADTREADERRSQRPVADDIHGPADG